MKRLRPLERAGVLAILVLATQASDAWALDRHRQPSQYVQRSFRTEDGLPSNGVYAVAETPDGYLWVGTSESLARFDGTQFKTFDDPALPTALRGSTSALGRDDHGTLWIGTAGSGVAAYADGVFRSIGTETPLEKAWIKDFAFPPGDEVIIATLSGLFVYAKSTEVVRRVTGLASERITAVHHDAAGRLWVGTDDAGAFMLTTLRGESPRRASSGQVTAIFGDRNGRTWVAGEHGAQCFLDLAPCSAPNSRGKHYALSAATDRDGNLWVGTLAGLERWGTGGLATFPSHQIIANSAVYSVFEDSRGDLWVGADGLHQLRDGRLVKFSSPPGMRGAATAVTQLHAGAILIGTGGGLALADRQGARKIELPIPIDTAVLTLLEDRHRQLWVGTKKGGVLRGSLGGPWSAETANLPEPMSVASLMESRDGTVWLGSRGFLTRFLPGTGTFEIMKGIPQTRVTSLLEDSGGTLWAGTLEGLFRLNGDRFEPWKGNSELPDQKITALAETREGALWIGTYGGGIARSDGKTVQLFTETEGLPDAGIRTLLEDRLGHLWVCSASGLYFIDLTLQRADTRRLSVVELDESDGAAGTGCYADVQPASWLDREGMVWFATNAGALRVDPRVARSRPAPNVLFEEISWDGATQPLDSRRPHLEVPPGSKRLEVRFTAPSFVAPKRILFRYRLLGFDERWTTASAARSARFTRLPPGEYRLQVSVSSPDGVWTKTPAELAFAVLPAWHERTSVRGSALVMFLLAVFAGHRRIVRHLEHRAQRLEGVVKERTWQLEKANRELAKLAISDGLTGLANRRRFDEVLESEFQRASRGGSALSLILLDVDHFKTFNDTYGHTDGDACLQAVAKALAASAKRPGDLVARYGGEEFALLLPGVSEHDAMHVAETCRRQVEALALAHCASTTAPVVTISLGVAATGPNGPGAPVRLIELADEALYQAKRSGRNRVAIADTAQVLATA